MGNKKWTLILFLIGAIVGLVHPSNAHGTVETSLAFALPFGLAGALIGFAIDKFVKK
jgi:ammonia channel protein AmtB